MVFHARQISLLILCTLLIGCGSNSKITKANIGLIDQQLKDCPRSPNCVSTFAKDKKHAAVPWSYTGSIEETKMQVEKICRNYIGAELVAGGSNYLHYTFKTNLGGFLDDVEFYFDDENKLVHFRSASRVGYGDFGANKRRMKKLQKEFQ